jgi:hypothetical protein
LKKGFVLFAAILLGTYVAALDSTYPVYTPHLLNISTRIDNSILFTSSLNLRGNYTLVSVTRTYVIQNPLVPYMNITLVNPSNFSTASGSPYSTFYGQYNVLGVSTFGSVVVTYERGPSGNITGLEIHSDSSNGLSSPEVILSYYDIVTGRITASALKQSMPLANGTTVVTIGLTVADKTSDLLHVVHLFVLDLQANSTYAGSCNCTSGVSFTKYSNSPELYIDFYVQPHQVAQAVITVKTPKQP